MAIYARKVTVQHEILATGKLVVSRQQKAISSCMIIDSIII